MRRKEGNGIITYQYCVEETEAKAQSKHWQAKVKAKSWLSHHFIAL